ncbi:MAG TPA: hypothetical protein VI365_02680, partial [Trebonia sp.]
MKLSNGIAVLTAAALAGLLAVPGSARAATVDSGATASVTFQSASVAAGVQPEVTFITTGTPAGAVVYLQEEGTDQPWRSIGRIRATSGTVRAPADQAGSYLYRIMVESGSGAALVTSAPVALTVTGAQGSSPSTQASPAPTASAGGGCTACGIANDALPWLA